MKLKQIHIRSPQDDEDLSCILVKSELSGNENQTNNPESMDCLLIPNTSTSGDRGDHNSYLEHSELLHQSLIQTTNELTSLLSRVDMNESQVIVVNNHHSRHPISPPPLTSQTSEDTVVSKHSMKDFKDILPSQLKVSEYNHESHQYILGGGDIILFNQNTKTKIAERHVIHLLLKKYLKTWHHVYKAHQIHRVKVKKLIIKEWQKISGEENPVEGNDMNSFSTEKMMDNSRMSYLKSFKSPTKLSPNAHPKVLTIDIATDDLHSIPSQLGVSSNIPTMTVPSTINIPVVIPKTLNPSNKNGVKETAQRIKSKDQVQSSVQSQMKEKSGDSNRLYRYHQQQATVSSKNKTRSMDSQESTNSTITSNQAGGTKKKELKLKYPNLQVISNFVNLYESQAKELQQELKPTKLYKNSDKKSVSKKTHEIQKKSSSEQKNTVFSPETTALSRHDNESVSSLSSVSMVKDKSPMPFIRRLSTMRSPLKALLPLNNNHGEGLVTSLPSTPLQYNYPVTVNAVTVNTNDSSHNYSPSTTITNPSHSNTNPTSLSSMMLKVRQNSLAQPMQHHYRDNVSLCNIEPPRDQIRDSAPNSEKASVPNNQTTNNPPAFGRKLKEKLQKYNQNPLMANTSRNMNETNYLETNLTTYAAISSPPTQFKSDIIVGSITEHPRNASPLQKKLVLIKQKIQSSNEESLVANPKPLQPSHPISSNIKGMQQPFERENQPFIYNVSLQDRSHLLKKYLSRFLKFTDQSIYYWELNQYFNQYYLRTLASRYLRKLKTLTLVFQTDTVNTSAKSQSSKAFSSEVAHVWGSDFLGKKHVWFKWRLFHTRAQSNYQKEDHILLEIQKRQLSKAVIRWKQFHSQRQRLKRRIDKKLKKSPKSKFFTADQSNTTDDSSHGEDEEIGRTSINLSDLTKSGASPSLIFPNMEHSEEHTLSFRLDDDDDDNSIYLSTSSESEEEKSSSVRQTKNGFNPLDQFTPRRMLEAKVPEEGIFKAEQYNLGHIPIFTRKRLCCLIRYYRSYRYYQYYQQFRCLRSLLLNSIQNRLKRQMNEMARRHYHQKLLSSMWLFWKQSVNASYATSSPSLSVVDERELLSLSSSLIIDLHSLSDGYESYNSDS